tara:strand:+ start:158 stop:361 length:204 start_codon:yes stop_codon:yes gene_type:complete
MIIKSVEESLAKQNTTLEKKRGEASKREGEYMTVVEEQRRYFKAVKDFQDECNKNEMLSERVENLEE